MQIPNIKIILALIFGIGVVSIGVMHVLPKPQDKQENSTVEESSKAQKEAQRKAMQEKKQETITQSEKDTDGDGIKDWQELLYGLNPNKKDSNDDGVPDTLKGIAQATTTLVQDNAISSATGTKSLSVAMTRQIFAAYVKSKQNQTFDKKDFKAFVGDMTKQAYDKSILPEQQYTQKDIKHAVKANIANVKHYKQATALAAEPLADLGEYELTTYAIAVKSDDADDFAKLRTYANTYRRVAQNLMILPVPRDIVSEHLSLANAYISFAAVLEKMADSQSDPMLSFVAIREFLDIEKDIQKIFAHMNVYFKVDHHLE